MSWPTKGGGERKRTKTADIKVKKTKNLAGQLTNAEWMMSFPGTEEQKAGLLNCVGCHTLERVARSTHDADEWTHVVSRMMGYGAVSQPIKPQRMLDRNRAGTPEQYRKLAEYLATINLSATDHWAYDVKTGKWERFHPTDFLPKATAPARASIYQVISDSQNNLWMAEFQAGHIGKIDAKTTQITWWAVPTKNARARRMNIDDQDRLTFTEY